MNYCIITGMGASKLNRAVVLGWNLWAVLGGDLIGRSPRCKAGSDEMTYTIKEHTYSLLDIVKGLGY